MTTAPDGLPPLREVIARHGLSARKSLGQNFLMDLNLTARIARASGPLEGAEVVEVGPGPGGLTRALLAGGARVVAIERDRRCLPALEEIAGHWPGQLTVIESDAMKIDPRPHLSGPARIVANLPYNVGTALLVGWMGGAWPPWWESLTLMFQREVADRIVAMPGSRTYGRLSVLAQWRARPRIVFDVSPQAFTPPPKVTSAIVHIVPAEQPAGADPAQLEALTAAAFAQRRKMLRQSLKGFVATPSVFLEANGIDPTRRAESLSIAEFVALARALPERVRQSREDQVSPGGDRGG
ncbi:MAG TPA: 16S rRNA (adenine(1518)-N(6)/adenine(1519)-N(6))-dimethyltransferase RsmA [Paracoccaceae bacterium]|nr:16S rRNA (adenine(1518)-N(6)/adenine(1519)-N(6))-dimethyltransferase RsmA [Paracoccaceae bacterium]